MNTSNVKCKICEKILICIQNTQIKTNKKFQATIFMKNKLM